MRCRPAAACLLAGVLLTGCGTGTTAVTAAPAVPSAQPVAVSPQVAAAEGAGKAINLVAADVPGLVPDVDEDGTTPAEELAEKRADACLQGPPEDHYVAEVEGDSFGQPGALTTLGSVVEVMRDPAAAQKMHATLDHPRVGACMRDFIAENLALDSGGQILVNDLSTRGLDVSPPAGVVTRARRFEVLITVPGGKQGTLLLDVVLLQHRSTVVSLTTLAVEPFAAQERDRLVALLGKRLAASAV